MEWEKYPAECIVSGYPLHLDIELNTTCNLSCSFCPFHSPDAPFKPKVLENMNWSLYTKLIDEIEGKVNSIKLNFRGEPLLYPKIIEAIEYAKSKFLIVQINTNGVLLTSEMSSKLIKAGLDELLYSDYGNEKARKNVFNLYLRMELYDEKKPKLIIQYLENQEWFDTLESYTICLFDYHNIKEDHRVSDFKCSQPWQRFVVLADGTALSCSCGVVIPQKIIVNVKDYTIEDVWHSWKMRDLRHLHQNGLTHMDKACRLCPGRLEYVEKGSKSARGST